MTFEPCENVYVNHHQVACHWYEEDDFANEVEHTCGMTTWACSSLAFSSAAALRAATASATVRPSGYHQCHQFHQIILITT
jgi:hypothetical protein